MTEKHPTLDVLALPVAAVAAATAFALVTPVYSIIRSVVLLACLLKLAAVAWALDRTTIAHGEAWATRPAGTVERLTARWIGGPVRQPQPVKAKAPVNLGVAA